MTEGEDPRTTEELARLAGKDKGAFDALYRRLNGHVRTCARRHLHTKNDHVLDHVCEEVWFEVARKAAEFKGDSFTAWLLGVTGMVCLRHQEDAQTDLERHVRGQEVASPTPGIETSDLAQDVRQALAALPEVERTVLVLKVFRELTFEKVAQRTGISRGQVERVLASAIERIRPHLASWGPRPNTGEDS